ncbi:GntR family transcriptional regulator [Myceligenerans indicum]|uniref:GntR family transcriptional regulator n=1 Tax=Myceligenerans indicum TaxID=2593663 RepID=A0ABS1LJX3_9MICO|nr:GntR family transcriptional regulator [Myceligenerans indicum]MBL0886501.1 GntR family transcriptional regulator [Myceligenerans indicum]
MITIDAESSVPPFEQVRTGLARRMADGTLPVGARLPTVRALAGELGIAVNTVARAYRELEAARLVETRGRAGTFVSPGGSRTLEAARAAAESYAETVHGLGLDPGEALRIVSAALDRRPGG